LIISPALVILSIFDLLLPRTSHSLMSFNRTTVTRYCPSLITSPSPTMDVQPSLLLVLCWLTGNRSKYSFIYLCFKTGVSSVTKTGEAVLCPQIQNMNFQQPAPLIRPVQPDVEMKPLPFYDVLDVLIKPSSLGATTTQRDNQEEYFILKAEQVRKLAIEIFEPGPKIFLCVFRFCLSETSCPQEDNYPNSLAIKVNDKLFRLPGSDRCTGYALPPKNGMEQKSPGRALNITSLVKRTSSVPNKISVTWAPEIGKIYSMSVYLVRQLTSHLVLQRLTMKGTSNPDHSRAQIKEKLTADPDSEVAITSLRVSLMCPLGKMRLTLPCRAVTCSHLQCFDAALYLQMNEKKPTWLCPVCDKKAAYESLIIDGIEHCTETHI
uniref:Protein inhibitor of activated STAT, 2 n=1 Tax=Oreochromis niloticus TaxID=8128 RepID=A0A669E920_ORENI